MKPLLVTILIATQFWVAQGKPIKVACVGDSITYGAAVEDRENNAYPARLGRLLGEGWEVGNFGRNGATLSKNTYRPYWELPHFREATSFLPDVVIIKLGTNDSKPYVWDDREHQFAETYRSLITHFQNLDSEPKVFVCLPAPAFGVRWEIRPEVIENEILPLIKNLATDMNVPVIDIFSLLEDKPEFLPDKIHPDARGAKLMADHIYEVLMQHQVGVADGENS